jgi:cell shape-determining protein MreC
VVLDVGEAAGAKEGGIVMVRRGDKLIGKAKIITVEANRSVANLMSDWKQGDVAVAAGDSVLY